MKEIGIRLVLSLKYLIEKSAKYINEELLLSNGEVDEGTREYSLYNLVEKARNEWTQSKKLFEEVNDPDLVDHAIYAMQAAERKYMYLLKQAKEENLKSENILGA